MARVHIVRVFQDGSTARVDSIDTVRSVVDALVDHLMRENCVVRDMLETPYGRVTGEERNALSAYERSIRTMIKIYPTTAAVHGDDDGVLTIATME